ncbi:helix-turn-helix transcriptional regulator [Roseivivax sp. CAU 1753]
MPHRNLKDRSQQTPFPDATDLHFRLARSFDLINNWNAALCGRYDMRDVLAVMIRQLDACNIVLFRFDHDRPLPVSAACRSIDGAKPDIGSGSLLHHVRQTDAAALLPGAILRLSRLRAEPGFAQSRAGREWDARPDIAECHLIVLGVADHTVDALEVAYRTPHTSVPELPDVLISAAMAHAWENRATGLISRQIREFSRGRTAPVLPGGADLLGPHNPAGLSRAEQRVCQVLAGGDSARDIAETLDLSVSTIRTHLRNIYAKTGTDGQKRLIALINETRGRTE